MGYFEMKSILKPSEWLIVLLVTALFIPRCTDEVDVTTLLEKNSKVYKVSETDLYTGVANSYFSDGSIKERIQYRKGLKDGNVISYYHNGQKENEQGYKNGNLLELEWSTWDSTGQKRLEVSARRGIWKSWYADGQKKEDVSLLNGEWHGTSMEWYENGQIKESGVMNQGEKVGLWSEWYENGQLHRELFYEEDKLSGSAKTCAASDQFGSFDLNK